VIKKLGSKHSHTIQDYKQPLILRDRIPPSTRHLRNTIHAADENCRISDGNPNLRAFDASQTAKRLVWRKSVFGSSVDFKRDLRSEIAENEKRDDLGDDTCFKIWFAVSSLDWSPFVPAERAAPISRPGLV
jgi:hypothetical protein